jgi:dipeptidyl-peptidase-4
LEEQLRRERMRLFVNGVSTYEWGIFDADRSQIMLIPTDGGGVMVYDHYSDCVFQAYSPDSLGPAVDPHLSPTGDALAFVVSGDIYTVGISAALGFLHDSRDGKKTNHPSFQPGSAVSLTAATATATALVTEPTRITAFGGDPGISCGLADFCALEEMDRTRGYWWAPDGRSIAFCLVDERMVPPYDILHQGKADPRHVEMHRYPFSGEHNPSVRLAVAAVGVVLDAWAESAASMRVRAAEGDPNSNPPPSPPSLIPPSQLPPLPLELPLGPDALPRFMELYDPSWTENSLPTAATAATAGGPDSHLSDFYLARVGWWPDGSLCAQVQNRAQTVLQVLRLDAATGRRQVMMSSIYI